jgi:hypothetical protein
MIGTGTPISQSRIERTFASIDRASRVING